MPFIARTEILRRLRQTLAQHRIILGCGAGTGITAKFSERGGADLIIIYNSGRYRMAGRGSMAGLMPYGDANAIVVEMAREVLPIVRDIPVLAGVCGTDPFRLMPVFLKHLREMGFDGVQNFPTVGVMDGRFRQNLEETGMSYDLEVEMIHQAHELGMFTCPYAFTAAEAVKMATAGADVVVAHAGTTCSGSIGATSTLSLDAAVHLVQEIHDAAVAANPQVLVLCHGGPIAEPADVAYLLERTTGISGFFGASSIERLAVEPAIEHHTQAFKQVAMTAINEQTSWRQNS
jgi:predicted TIM-barrel enzyme